MSDDLYGKLAAARPLAARLGGALITMPQAHAGREEAFNRWYEDDHYISGAMVGPWIFAGRRFVRCDLARFSAPGGGATELGSFISLYWTLEGHLDETWVWVRAALKELIAEGRGPRDRTRVYSAMHELVFAHVFDPPPMAAIHALDYPYKGLAVELVDAPTPADRDRLIAWLRDGFVPAQAGAGGQCIAFVPRGLRDERKDESGKAGAGRDVVELAIDPNPDCRVCLLWFLREDPHEAWPGAFARHGRDIEASGRGRLVFLAPFVPTLPGTVTPLAGG